MHAIQFHQTGGPDVLSYDELDDPVPGHGELLVEVAAAGVNFIDTYHRSGLYPVPLPRIPGMEGAGIVRSIGSGVGGFAAGFFCRIRPYAAQVFLSFNK